MFMGARSVTWEGQGAMTDCFAANSFKPLAKRCTSTRSHHNSKAHHVNMNENVEMTAEAPKSNQQSSLRHQKKAAPKQ